MIYTADKIVMFNDQVHYPVVPYPYMRDFVTQSEFVSVFRNFISTAVKAQDQTHKFERTDLNSAVYEVPPYKFKLILDPADLDGKRMLASPSASKLRRLLYLEQNTKSPVK